MGRAGKVVIVLSAVVAAGAAVQLLLNHFLAPQPVTLEGAVLVRSIDVDKQVPIPDVRVTVGDDPAERSARSDPTGFFKLTLSRQFKIGQPIILQFRHPEYMPLNRSVLAGDRLCVARMVPLAESSPALSNSPQVLVSNITIRYSAKTTTLLNAGSVVKTFRVVNSGNVPCNGHYPCSPDGKWKATIGSANLDAPGGDVFSNARVSCIAGPCPFTRISSDGFSRGGSSLHVAILSWSDTTTFLFEAEVFRLMVSGSVRVSYPVIFGRTLHFTLPADAEGVYFEADIDRDSIVFPLGPEPILSWAACTESLTDHTKVYQCELKPGYRFK
jgi:hypothetical protein